MTKMDVEKVLQPGKAYRVDAAKFIEMGRAVRKVLPQCANGITPKDLVAGVEPLFNQTLFPGGDKAGWWAKTDQLDLEAKGRLSAQTHRPSVCGAPEETGRARIFKAKIRLKIRLPDFYCARRPSRGISMAGQRLTTARTPRASARAAAGASSTPSCIHTAFSFGNAAKAASTTAPASAERRKISTMSTPPAICERSACTTSPKATCPA
jgi:hypothetical protein